MTGESYEGWSNRATWLAHLWTANDEQTYYACMEIAQERMDDPLAVGQAIVPMIEAMMVVDENVRMDFTETVETEELDYDTYEMIYDIETRSILPDIDLKELGEVWITTTTDYLEHSA